MSDVQDLREITEAHVGWFSDRAVAYDYGYALAMTAAAAQRAGNASRAERFWTTLARADKALTAKPALVAQLRSGAMTGAARGRTGRATSGTQLRAVTRRDPADKAWGKLSRRAKDFLHAASSHEPRRVLQAMWKKLTVRERATVTKELSR